MRILVVLGHPRQSSFNHTIADLIKETLKSEKHQVVFHDLYEEKFDPVLTVEEIESRLANPIVDRYSREVVAAEGIVIIHPIWWELPPAIIKGWIDRVLSPGVAYDYKNGVSIGKLSAKFALVLNTSATAEETRRHLIGDPLQNLWCNGILGFCGINHVEYRVFPGIQFSTPEQKAAWLLEIEDLLNQMLESHGDSPNSEAK